MNKFGLIKNAQEEDKSSSADHVEELYVLKGLPKNEKLQKAETYKNPVTKPDNLPGHELASTSEKPFTKNLITYKSLKLKDEDDEDEIKIVETNMNVMGYNEAQRKLQIQQDKLNKQTIKPSVGFKHSPSFFGFSHRKKNPLEKEEYQNVELDDGTCPNEEIKPKTQSLKIQTGRMNTITGQDVEERKNSNDDCLINLYNPVSTKGQWNKFRLLKSIDKDKVTNIRMYTDDEKRIPVLAATKITKRSYDLFSVTDGIEIKVGILKWNFFGTEFNIYNTGQKPKSGITDNLRANLGAITYETNLFGSKGPQRIKVYIPKVVERQDEEGGKIHSYETNSTLIIPKNSNERIVKLKDTSRVMTFYNKPPIYHPKYKCYALDYHGRSIKQSLKNFQIISDPGNVLNEEVLFQFGNTGEDAYILDFKFPFSKLQAFAIAISSIEDKMFCE